MKKRILALVLALTMVMSMAACGTKNSDKNAKYTYNYALSEFPTNWNAHQYQTATDAEILDYIVDGFFTFDYNETKDGYKLVPAMATKEPEDVTAQYAAQYGIAADAKSRVWKITLRNDLKWQDGTAIKAQDFVTSAQLLLNPQAQNYRADSLYQGSMSLVNAKEYLYQGQHKYVTPMIATGDASEYVKVADIKKNADGFYYVGDEDKDLAFNLDDGCTWSSNSLSDYYGAYPDWFKSGDKDLYETVLKANADEDGWVKVNDAVYEVLIQFTAKAHGHADAAAYAEKAGDYAYQEWEEFCYYGQTFGEMSFDKVGIFAPSDYELVLVLNNALEGFYLLYSLTSSWLVNETLYKSLEKVDNGVYTNTYGTSVDTTMSYGPYKLTSFQADKQYVLERNENYYGLTKDTYQTTHIQVDCVKEASARLEMFLKGQLDSYGLQVEDMEKYQASDYTYYTTGDSTFFVALNPDKSALESEQAKLGADKNKTILTVIEFRQALAYAIDRAAFALATAPTNSPAFGVFSSLIVSDPENGTAYRTTEEAKWVLARFWGVADDIGEGKLYKTVDDAVASITGYNLEMAREKFNAAYDKAIADGLMDDNDVVEIKIGTPNNTSNFYNKGYDYLVNCYTEAVKGTKLEGKLTFSRDDTLGNGFSDALKANQVDMLFGVGWTGSALDPYGLMEAYTGKDYQYDPSWDTTTSMETVTIDGVEYTASVWDWTLAIMGEKITIKAADGTTKEFSAGSADGVDEIRFNILTVLENAVLETYDLIPLIDDASASLKGMQIKYYTEEYVYGVGRGGIKYYTYHYSDAKWEEFVSKQPNGSLNYN